MLRIKILKFVFIFFFFRLLGLLIKLSDHRKRIANLFREPLLHFLVIGAVLFLIFGWRGNPALLQGGQLGSPSAQVFVSQEDIDRMKAVYTKTWQRPPAEEELKGLVEDFVRNEIYYREAIAMGLDKDDEVLKRRLRQRMEFIFEDISSGEEPTEEELQVYMQKHSEKYRIDPQISFRQVYIDVSKRGQHAESDARQILARLKQGTDPETTGDPFLLSSEVPITALWDITKQFGESFSKSLLELEPGAWEGPMACIWSW
ncbi:MAG: hypothetical protein M0036_18020 [Desulfobacteraceae bacterium]|nr:hypothetical protein [Desulfobacteraceae bacterium]